jgi:signal transduction histidine kinase/CheY-like chemotaxis protein
MSILLDRMPLLREQDVVTARQRARQIAALVGFDTQDQSRIATAVSEITRNAIRYAGGGSIDYDVEGEQPPQVLLIRVADRGPGIERLQEILDGHFRSASGMGLGIVGAKRLMDQCDIASDHRGTVVTMKKLFDARAAPLSAQAAETLRAKLLRQQASGPFEELQQQQHELLVTLAEARVRQQQLTRLNREIEDTNRGVVALYAELDEKADHLRRADEMKSRFLSNMSHEFRTPLNSIRALSGLLLERVDGPLSDEQERQVKLIRKATDDLSSLVEDLLDLARIEAGKLEIHAATFEVEDLFSALRGMLRPLLAGEAVALRFEPAAGVPPIRGDEAKVSQILRNFISNALKFTQQGSVTVSARHDAPSDSVVFCVADTGVGIAKEDQERIFEEFVQVRGPLQRKVKGTGLGLPLCRRLAEALGGSVRVDSAPGEGARFFVGIPVRYAEIQEPVVERPALPAPESWRVPVLVVEDAQEMQLFYEKALRDTPYRPVAAQTLHQATSAIEGERPALIVLDIMLRNEDVWRWLAELKDSPATATIPVLVISSLAEERKALALGANRFVQKPISRADLLGLLDDLTGLRVLIVEDDTTTRYAMRKRLDNSEYLVLEAASGEEGLRAAQAARPHSIVLDLGLPDIDGFAMLDHLKASPLTQDVPVIVATARDLSDAERSVLASRAFAVLSKRDILANIVATLAAATPPSSRPSAVQ